MKREWKYLLVGVAALWLAACGGKKQTDDIIAQEIEEPQPQAPISQQEFTKEQDVQWIGRTYHLYVQREPCDSLPKVQDEMGQEFIDNVATVTVSRADGLVFFKRQFQKSDFSAQLSEEYLRQGVLEGLVFEKTDGDWLQFAASISLPQTDEFIPFVIRLSRMGELKIVRESTLDADSAE